MDYLATLNLIHEYQRDLALSILPRDLKAKSKIKIMTVLWGERIVYLQTSNQCLAIDNPTLCKQCECATIHCEMVRSNPYRRHNTPQMIEDIKLSPWSPKSHGARLFIKREMCSQEKHMQLLIINHSTGVSHEQ